MEQWGAAEGGCRWQVRARPTAPARAAHWLRTCAPPRRPSRRQPGGQNPEPSPAHPIVALVDALKSGKGSVQARPAVLHVLCGGQGRGHSGLGRGWQPHAQLMAGWTCHGFKGPESWLAHAWACRPPVHPWPAPGWRSGPWERPWCRSAAGRRGAWERQRCDQPARACSAVLCCARPAPTRLPQSCNRRTRTSSASTLPPLQTPALALPFPSPQTRCPGAG